VSTVRPFRRLAAVAVSLLVLGPAGAVRAAQLPPVPPLPPIPPLPAPLPQPAGTPQEPSASAQSAPPAQRESATATRASTALERSVAAEINVVRRAHGRTGLALSAPLQRAAEEHARNLAEAGLFAHSWSDSTPFGTWIRRFYPAARARTWSVGENLAWSAPGVTAKQAVEMWLASPEHRRILLGRRWRQLGLGVIAADGAGGVYGGQDVVVLAAEFGVRR
jgi:uncharacterized protein YkwD